MFVLPYDALLYLLGTTREKVAAGTHVNVSIPVPFLMFILKNLLESGELDSASYVAANPDVAEAVRKRIVSSAAAHYVNYGYWEGRRGAPVVDGAWYLKNNPDVAAAVRNKKVASAEEHYYCAGAREFRAPNSALVDNVQSWASLFGKPAGK